MWKWGINRSIYQRLERRVFEIERDTDEKCKDESGEDGKDGPNTESVGEGRDPRIGIIVPEIVDVRVPEI